MLFSFNLHVANTHFIESVGTERYNFLCFQVILVLLSIANKCSSICTPVYGREPCSFVPAPPGHVPSCARPGLTYCEHPSHYPGQLILYLLEKWRYDHATLLSDESRDEFNSYFVSTDSKYATNNMYGLPNSIHPDSYFPEPIHIPKPAYPTFYPSGDGNTYIPPPAQNFTEFAGYPDRRPTHVQPQVSSNQLVSYKYSKNPFVHSQYPTIQNTPNIYKLIGQPQINQYNPNDWWKRYARDERQIRRKRSVKTGDLRRKMATFENPFNYTSAVHTRRKRQNPLTGQTLCESRSQYIMPRAAVNNKGNWMYIVNMPELDNRFTQLVKSETCASQQCNGLCSLPAGYSSRCEQKYVQKRLVALEGGGNQLYTDVFWFPSCCICTIST